MPWRKQFIRAMEEVIRFRSWPYRRTLRHSSPRERRWAMAERSIPPEPQVGS
ncbi:MAG TPA: hypothetical protein PLL16_10290 [Methanoculleus sp.]|nr:hypothetical protein [Methanoculleus sp.]